MALIELLLMLERLSLWEVLPLQRGLLRLITIISIVARHVDLFDYSPVPAHTAFHRPLLSSAVQTAQPRRRVVAVRVLQVIGLRLL